MPDNGREEYWPAPPRSADLRLAYPYRAGNGHLTKKASTSNTRQEGPSAQALSSQSTLFWRGLLRRFESISETPPSRDEKFRSPTSASVSKTGLLVSVFKTELLVSLFKTQLLVGVFKTRRLEKLRLRRTDLDALHAKASSTLIAADTCD